MSRVDFYVLSASGDGARQHFACRLAEKAYRKDHTVHIGVDSSDLARRIDELLWTFRDGSFVPHDLLRSGDDEITAPVTVGGLSSVPRTADLLINLSASVPEIAGTFPRIAEIVTSDDESKSRSRQNFVAYRDAGHELESHDI